MIQSVAFFQLFVSFFFAVGPGSIQFYSNDPFNFFFRGMIRKNDQGVKREGGKGFCEQKD